MRYFKLAHSIGISMQLFTWKLNTFRVQLMFAKDIQIGEPQFFLWPVPIFIRYAIPGSIGGWDTDSIFRGFKIMLVGEYSIIILLQQVRPCVQSEDKNENQLTNP